MWQAHASCLGGIKLKDWNNFPQNKTQIFSTFPSISRGCEIGATECWNTLDSVLNTDLSASCFVSKQTKLLIRWKGDNIYIYIYIWIPLHFSTGGHANKSGYISQGEGHGNKSGCFDHKIK